MAERVVSLLHQDLPDDPLANYSEERAMTGSTLVARLAGMYPAVGATMNNEQCCQCERSAVCPGDSEKQVGGSMRKGQGAGQSEQ